MQLAFALLADAAQISPDGKLHLIGGGFDNVFSATVPAVHPTMALVLRFLLTSEEARSSHHLRIRLSRTSDQFKVMEVENQFEVDAEEHQTGIIGMGLVLNLQQLVFPSLDDYAFTIAVDGDPVGTLPIRVASPLNHPAPAS